MHNMVCATVRYLREKINKFLVGQVSGHDKNFKITILSDTICVRLYMVVLLIELILFISFSVFRVTAV